MADLAPRKKLAFGLVRCSPLGGSSIACQAGWSTSPRQSARPAGAGAQPRGEAPRAPKPLPMRPRNGGTRLASDPTARGRASCNGGACPAPRLRARAPPAGWSPFRDSFLLGHNGFTGGGARSRAQARGLNLGVPGSVDQIPALSRARRQVPPDVVRSLCPRTSARINLRPLRRRRWPSGSLILRGTHSSCCRSHAALGTPHWCAIRNLHGWRADYAISAIRPPVTRRASLSALRLVVSRPVQEAISLMAVEHRRRAHRVTSRPAGSPATPGRVPPSSSSSPTATTPGPASRPPLSTGRHDDLAARGRV
jgi:hypothetical protein